MLNESTPIGLIDSHVGEKRKVTWKDLRVWSLPVPLRKAAVFVLQGRKFLLKDINSKS